MKEDLNQHRAKTNSNQHPKIPYEVNQHNNTVNDDKKHPGQKKISLFGSNQGATQGAAQKYERKNTKDHERRHIPPKLGAVIAVSDQNLR